MEPQQPAPDGEGRELFALAGRVRRTKGGTSCCVPGCYNNNKEDSQTVSFHQFPTDRATSRLWTTRIGRPADWRPLSSHRICGNHFHGRMKSREHPNPTIFPLRPDRRYNQVLGAAARERENRRSRRADASSTSISDASAVPLPSSPNEESPDPVQEGHSCMEEDEDELTKLREEVALLRRTHFSLDRLKQDNKAFRYYTGLTRYSVMKALYTCLFERSVYFLE